MYWYTKAIQNRHYIWLIALEMPNKAREMQKKLKKKLFTKQFKKCNMFEF